MPKQVTRSERSLMVHQFENLSPKDVQAVAGGLPVSLRRFIESRASSGQTKKTLVVAGGFVRDKLLSQTPKDIDVFLVSCEPEGPLEVEKTASDYAQSVYNTVDYTEFSCVVGKVTPIQFVYKWVFSSIEHILNHFDFNICKACIYFDGSEWRGLASEGFWQGVESRLLEYTGSDLPGSSLMRAFRFTRRGYGIGPEVVSGIVRDIVVQVIDSTGDGCDIEDMVSEIVGQSYLSAAGPPQALARFIHCD